MKRIDRYVTKELIVPFLIGTVGVVLMFQANEYIYLAKTMDLSQVPTQAVLQYLLLKTPLWLSMTLPIGMALAASMAISRLTRESELTAMRAGGTRILRVLLPVVVFGFFVSILNFVVVERVIPPSLRQANQIAQQVGVLAVSPTFRPNAFITFRRFGAKFGSVRKVSSDVLELKDAFLIESPQVGVNVFIMADIGTYKQGVWTFPDAKGWRFQGDKVDVFRGRLTFNEKIVVEDIFMPPGADEQTIPELLEAMENARKIGGDLRRLEIAYWVKFSVPSACVVFALVAPVFAVLLARGGAFLGVLASVVVVMLYYNSFVISTQILSRHEQVPAWLAAFAPNLIFLALGLAAVRRLE